MSNIQHLNIPPENHVKVLDGQGWVGMIDHLGSEATIVNAARVSFGKLKKEIDERDVTLLHYLIDNKHTSPLEHLVFTFSIHCRCSSADNGTATARGPIMKFRADIRKSIWNFILRRNSANRRRRTVRRPWTAPISTIRSSGS